MGYHGQEYLQAFAPQDYSVRNFCWTLEPMQYFYQDLSCKYPAHHELETVLIIVIVIIDFVLLLISKSDIYSVHDICASLHHNGLRREDWDPSISTKIC